MKTGLCVCFLLVLITFRADLRAQGADVQLRGHRQALQIYGMRSGQPVIVSSGDGGWIHLAPHVAETLAAKGFFVIGFDVRSYLQSFTSGALTLNPEDVRNDLQTLVAYAAGSNPSRKPILIGVSEGAGLSVLAATNPGTKRDIAGVIGLGLPDKNELGWRWRDSLIYLTHGIPNEPLFSAAAVIGQVAPVPLAAIHSSEDEFVPVSQVQRTLLAANEPKKLWVVKASNHRFSDNIEEFDQRLLEAIDWLKTHQPH
jgi:alpha-beta hydrolase superfamily lysophospholipase